MASTFLTLVQRAVDELGSIATPAFVFGNQDLGVRQLLALAIREGVEFAAAANGRGGWPELIKSYSFNLVPGQATYPMPSDWAFWMPQTAWDQPKRWQLLGPLTEQEWSVLQYGISPAGPRLRFTYKAGLIYINPTPDATQPGPIIMAYFSNAWCESASGTPQTRWQADTDTYRLDEECFILGLKWRFLRAKGLDYAQEKTDYERFKEQALARAGGSRTLPIDAQMNGGFHLLSDANLPDTGFGA